MGGVRSVSLEWTGTGMQFRTRGDQPASPEIMMDGDNEIGASPMQHLLMAAGVCAAVDVVMILQKMRVDLKQTAVKVTGERRDEVPKRFMAIRFVFELAGEGLDRVKAERAVALSIQKYCSVLHTLAADLDVSCDVVLS
jgi:putative redox protein